MPTRARLSEVEAASARVDGALAALAEPNRKAIVNVLSAHPQRAGEIAEALGVSPQALARHLRVLRRSGLIEYHVSDTPEDDARVRVYQLRKEPFDDLREWLDEVETFWVNQLSAFRDRVERQP